MTIDGILFKIELIDFSNKQFKSKLFKTTLYLINISLFTSSDISQLESNRMKWEIILIFLAIRSIGAKTWFLWTFQWEISVSRLLTISLVPVKNGDSFTYAPTFLPLCEGQSTLAFVIQLLQEIRNLFVSSPYIRVGVHETKQVSRRTDREIHDQFSTCELFETFCITNKCYFSTKGGNIFSGLYQLSICLTCSGFSACIKAAV